MLSLLGAITTETIIGIIAIIVIVISVGIIVATAVRNYLLHKKAVAEKDEMAGFVDNDAVQEIDGESVDSVEVEKNVGITAEDETNASVGSEVESEFDEEVVQEIEFDAEKVPSVATDEIKGAKIEDNSMKELEEKLSNQ